MSKNENIGLKSMGENEEGIAIPTSLTNKGETKSSITDSAIKIPTDLQGHNLTEKEALPFKKVGHKNPTQLVVFDSVEIYDEYTYKEVDVLKYNDFTLYLYFRHVRGAVRLRFRVDVPGKGFTSEIQRRNREGDSDDELSYKSSSRLIPAETVESERLITIPARDIFGDYIVFPPKLSIGIRTQAEEGTGEASCMLAGVEY